MLTKDHAEIDLIVERPGKTTLLIEIKSSDNIDDRAVKTLKQFINDISKSEALVLSKDKKSKLIDGIQCYYWQDGINKIFK